MIGMLSHVVVASAQTFIPKWALGEVITKEISQIDDRKDVSNKNEAIDDKSQNSWVSINF